MAIITQTKRYLPHEISTKVQSVQLYRSTKDISFVCRRYHISKASLMRWNKQYDGTKESLLPQSHKPYTVHPNAHTAEELKLIQDMRRRNPNAGLVVFWVKLRQRGYTRTISGLYRVLRRTEQGVVKLPNPKYVAKPYEQMQYPGQRVQIDVKFVPAACLVGAAAEDA